MHFISTGGASRGALSLLEIFYARIFPPAQSSRDESRRGISDDSSHHLREWLYMCYTKSHFASRPIMQIVPTSSKMCAFAP